MFVCGVSVPKFPTNDSLPDIGCDTCPNRPVYRGLCPVTTVTRHLPLCTSTLEASQGGQWLSVASLGVPQSDLDTLGLFGELCWQPLSCRLAPLSAADARTCLANQSVLVLGDSNAVHVTTVFAGMAGATALRSAACDTAAGRSTATDFFHIPSEEVTYEECYDGGLFARRYVSPNSDARVLYVPTLSARDSHFRTKLSNTTHGSLHKYFWRKQEPLPALALCNVGLHDLANFYDRLSAADAPHSFNVNATVASYEYPLRLRHVVSRCAASATRNAVWLLTPTVHTALQPEYYQQLTTSRRVVLVNAWAHALVRRYPGMDVVDTAGMSAFEFPELHSDGVHLHGYHDALYSAVRDIVLTFFCKRGFPSPPLPAS